jgi:hypothetical protein
MNTGLADGTLPIDPRMFCLARLPIFCSGRRGGLFFFPSMPKSPPANFSRMPLSAAAHNISLESRHHQA